MVVTSLRGGEGHAGSEKEINKNGEQRRNHEKNCFFKCSLALIPISPLRPPSASLTTTFPPQPPPPSPFEIPTHHTLITIYFPLRAIKLRGPIFPLRSCFLMYKCQELVHLKTEVQTQKGGFHTGGPTFVWYLK